MIIFLSGSITNNPTYREQFAAAEKRLSEQGHIVLNPAVFPEGMPYENYMTICFAMIDVSDAIYQLRGWDESSGAIRERSRATMRGIKVIEEAGDDFAAWEAEQKTPEYIVTDKKTGSLAFRCLICEKMSVYPEKTADGRTCAHCHGHITPIGYARKVKHNAV